MRVKPKEESIHTAPRLHSLPPETKPRLVDTGLLHLEPSAAGNAERYRRGETPHTIHVWWARRPHTAMRSLVFACLCTDSSVESRRIMVELSKHPEVPPALLSQARTIIEESFSTTPTLLDMFGGGGTIPYEAVNLGARTSVVDSNELSVFIQKCLLEYSVNVDVKRIPALLNDCGTRVLARLAAETKHLFPMRERVFGYYWTYSINCPGCGNKIYLAKRPWLSLKRDRRLAIRITYINGNTGVTVGDVDEDFAHPDVWKGRDGSFTCPHCRKIQQGITIAQCRDEMIAIAKLPEKSRGGKLFEGACGDCIPNPDVIASAERDALQSLGVPLPSSPLPKWSGIVNASLYGIRSHADFLNPRQRALLLLLIKQLRLEYDRLVESESPQAAKFVIGLLSGLIDQLVDWNCRLSMWIPQNEQVGRAFCGPGVAMLWDYMETDPVMNGPGNLWDKLKRIQAGARHLTDIPAKADVRKAYAQSLPFDDNSFDAVVTDPPYYDNIFYNALADFFYSWKRVLCRVIDPELFAPDITDGSRELVASTFRSGSPMQAHEDYCKQLAAALREAERVMLPTGVFAIVYSHASLAGWEAFLRAYRKTGLRITSVQPLSVERRQRPRAMTSQSVNTCMVFISRKYSGGRIPLSLEDIRLHVRDIAMDFASRLVSAGWHERDVAISVFAQGVAIISNASHVNGFEDDCKALLALESIVKEHFSSFSMLRRKSL